MTTSYPIGAHERSRWILSHRSAKAALDPSRAYATVWEEELDAAGVVQPVAAVFLTNKECPYRCLMCDLWRQTLDRAVPAGNIPNQIRAALSTVPAARHVKLYNAGSFFDPGAIPVADDEAIARAVDSFDRVIVESHPAFLTGRHRDRCLRFRDAIAGELEIAVGLETAHEATLARLNKGMTLDSFRRAAEFLASRQIALRVFILLKPPFTSEDEGIERACRSIDFAIGCGATVCTVIPTRGGNGALEALGDDFAPPALASLERVIEYGISRGQCRVFADLWDVERLFTCACAEPRAERLRTMNRRQVRAPSVDCAACAR